MRPTPRLSAMRLALISLLSTLALLTGCSSDEGFYGGCEGSDECVPDAECVVVAFEAGRDGAMCTADCVVNTDCPGNSACYELLGDPIEGQKVCYQRCEFDSDCSPNFTCAEAAMGAAVIDFICLPL